MKCSNCGAELPDHAKYCISCGAELDVSGVPSGTETSPGTAVPASDGESPVYTDFYGAIRLFFTNYFNFSGRSTRSEYWYAVLFIIITDIVLLVIDELTGGVMLSMTWRLLIFIPSLALGFRRLHDVGKKGTIWIIIEAITVILRTFDSEYTSYDEDMLLLSLASVGFILSIIMLACCCAPSEPEENEYGRAPYPADVDT